jgi:hypothetical protein
MNKKNKKMNKKNKKIYVGKRGGLYNMIGGKKKYIKRGGGLPHWKNHTKTDGYLQYLISSHGSINGKHELQFNLKDNDMFLHTYTELGIKLSMDCGFKLSTWLTHNRENNPYPPAKCGMHEGGFYTSNLFPNTTIWSDPDHAFTSGVLDISRVGSPQNVFTFESDNLSMPLTRLLKLIKLHTENVHKKTENIKIEVHCLFCLEPEH